MRFVTFNVLNGRPMRDGRPVDGFPGGAPAEPLAGAVAALGADVLALQEVDRLQERSGAVEQARAAAEAMGARDWRYAAALHGRPVPGKGWVLDPGAPRLRMYGPGDAAAPGDTPSHGVALLTRLPVRAWRARRLEPAPLKLPLRIPGRPGLTLIRDSPRAALAAVLDGERGPFTVVALHLSFVPGRNAAQLLTLRRWIADLPRPHLLLGDFNLVAALPRTVLNATGPGWRDLARTPTYPSHRPRVQFDHILSTGLSAARHPVRWSTPRSPVSDHRPLVVDLD